MEAGVYDSRRRGLAGSCSVAALFAPREDADRIG